MQGSQPNIPNAVVAHASSSVHMSQFYILKTNFRTLTSTLPRPRRRRSFLQLERGRSWQLCQRSQCCSHPTSGNRTHPEDAVDEAAELEPEAEDDPLLAFELAVEPEEAVALAAPDAPEAPEAAPDDVAVPLIRKPVSVVSTAMPPLGDLPGSALGRGLERVKGLVPCRSGVDPITSASCSKDVRETPRNL